MQSLPRACRPPDPGPALQLGLQPLRQSLGDSPAWNITLGPREDDARRREAQRYVREGSARVFARLLLLLGPRDASVFGAAYAWRQLARASVGWAFAGLLCAAQAHCRNQWALGIMHPLVAGVWDKYLFGSPWFLWRRRSPDERWPLYPIAPDATYYPPFPANARYQLVAPDPAQFVPEGSPDSDLEFDC